jgi:hypothetical protein
VGRFDWINAYFLTRFILILKSNQPVGKCEKGIVPSHPDIVSRMELRAQLTNYYIAGAHEFAAEFFDAPALARAVAAIAGTSARFFMCHDIPPKSLEAAGSGEQSAFGSTASNSCREHFGVLPDVFHAHRRVSLPVPLPFTVIFAPFVLENYDFGQPPLFDYGGVNRDSLNERLPDPNLLPVGEKKHLVDGNVFPDFAGYLFHFHYVSRPGFVLPSTGPEDGVHDLNPPKLACCRSCLQNIRRQDKKSGPLPAANKRLNALAT